MSENLKESEIAEKVAVEMEVRRRVEANMQAQTAAKARRGVLRYFIIIVVIITLAVICTEPRTHDECVSKCRKDLPYHTSASYGICLVDCDQRFD